MFPIARIHIKLFQPHPPGTLDCGLYRGFTQKLLFVNNINVNVDAFTFHSHPLPELLLQSALPILQLQLSSAWG